MLVHGTVVRTLIATNVTHGNTGLELLGDHCAVGLGETSQNTLGSFANAGAIQVEADAVN